MKISLSRIPGQTPFGVFQNVCPREWPEGWYFDIHLGPYRLSFYHWHRGTP
jgi:hypothetical protein